MTSGLKQGDLDKLLEQFVVFQKYTSEGHSKAALLEEQLESANKLMAAKQEREQQLQQEIEELQGIVSQLQGILTKRCDMEEENRTVKQELTEMKASLQSVEQAHRDKLAEMDVNMDDQQTAQKVALLELEEEFKEKAQEERAKSEQTLQARDQQIQQLQKQITEQDRANQAELMKLRLEYDAKLLKVQKQTNRVQQATQGAGANQDIFRKKLQHAKAESEREINSLKRTVQDLEQKLASHGQSRPTLSTVQPKKRRV